MGKRGLEFEQRVTADQAADFLEEVAKGLRARTLEVSAGDKVVRLSPTNIVKLELEASGDDDKQELCLEMKWHVPELPGLTAEPGLSFTSTPPPATETPPQAR